MTGLWAANYNDAEGSFWIREFCVSTILCFVFETKDQVMFEKGIEYDVMIGTFSYRLPFLKLYDEAYMI